MSGEPKEPYEQYLARYKDYVLPYHEGARVFEKHAIDFAFNAVRTVTYLNGGGLIAIPAAVALFQTNPREVKTSLLLAALGFITSLVFVTAAQICGFFAMANRSAREDAVGRSTAFAFIKQLELATGQKRDAASRDKELKQHEAEAARVWKQFNRLRSAGIVLLGLSVLGFCFGCIGGASAILHVPTPK
jgi:hypothetical protein